MIDPAAEGPSDATSLEHVPSTKPCRLDGNIVRFPLAPEAIDNLPLLREASKDLTKHLATVQKRIVQLEEKEREKSMNPWDLV
jgi:hypothetical protein